MKRFLPILLLLLLAACGKEGYDFERARDLTSLGESRQLTEDETAELISLGNQALTDVQQALSAALKQDTDEKFLKEYNNLMADDIIIEKSQLGERIWRVLLLARPRLTESNLEAFNALYDTRRIVDVLVEDVDERLAKITNE